MSVKSYVLPSNLFIKIFVAVYLKIEDDHSDCSEVVCVYLSQPITCSLVSARLDCANSVNEDRSD